MRYAAATPPPRDLLHAIWARMDAVNPQLNAVIWLDREAAEQAARAADQAVKARAPLGRLHGVPLAHKDMYYQAGKLSTCGSALRKDYRPATTATVVERMAAAGAYTFAGLNMAEFAQNPTGHNRTYGDCHNPWNLPRTSPAVRRPGPVRRWRRGSTTPRWAPIPAGRSACPPRRVASPASSRRRPACRAPA